MLSFFAEKTFNKPLLEPFKLERIDGEVRRYVTPEGNKYPSVTSILKPLDDGGLEKWKKRVGKKTAKQVVERASERGDELHKAIEEYYLGTLDKKNLSTLTKTLFGLMLRYLNKVSLVLGLELSMYSDTLKLAGTADLIAIYEKSLIVGDFKGSNSKINKTTDYGRRKLFKYFIQGALYSKMLYERYNIEAEEVVILLAAEFDRTVQEFRAPVKDFDKEIDIISRAYHNNDEELLKTSLFWRL